MIRIGIIGCGKIAQVRHLPEYAANPHVEPVSYTHLDVYKRQSQTSDQDVTSKPRLT